MFSKASIALTGATNGSVIMQESAYRVLLSALTKIERIIRASIAKETRPNMTDTVFAIRYKKSSKSE